MSLLSVQCRHRYPDGFGLDLAFETAEPTTSLFGPSGSGKSSALAVIAGLLRPDSGRVELDGEVWLDSARGVCLPPDRRRVGMVFQEPLLFPHLSVEGNLRYGLRRRRGEPERVGLAKVVEVLELGDLLGRPPRSLSGGQRQRVGLGRALLRNPRLLLLDEPLVALDDLLKQRILAYLERVLAQWQVPTLYVSHSQAEVRRLARWVVAIDRGRVIESGPPEAVLGHPLGFEAPTPAGPDGLLGPTNLVRVEALEPLGQGTWRGRLGGQPVSLPLDDDATEAALRHGTCYVLFSPQAVTLSAGPVAPSLSAQNRLPGVVQRLLPHQGRVLVLVDVGQPVWAEVTPQAVEALGLHPGAEVTCLIKTTAMRIIP